MGLLRNLKTKYEFSKRVGAFARAKRKGLMDKDAWDYANRIYPPSPKVAEYEYRMSQKDKGNS